MCDNEHIQFIRSSTETELFKAVLNDCESALARVTKAHKENANTYSHN